MNESFLDNLNLFSCKSNVGKKKWLTLKFFLLCKRIASQHNLAKEVESFLERRFYFFLHLSLTLRVCKIVPCIIYEKCSKRSLVPHFFKGACPIIFRGVAVTSKSVRENKAERRFFPEISSFARGLKKNFFFTAVPFSFFMQSYRKSGQTLVVPGFPRKWNQCRECPKEKETYFLSSLDILAKIEVAANLARVRQNL